MAVNMKGKSLLTIHELSLEEVWQIFELSKSLKEKRLSGESHRLLEGKKLGMIFSKPSTKRSSGREPITQPPGCGNDTLPKRARTGPVATTDARIFLAIPGVSSVEKPFGIDTVYVPLFEQTLNVVNLGNIGKGNRITKKNGRRNSLECRIFCTRCTHRAVKFSLSVKTANN